MNEWAHVCVSVGGICHCVCVGVYTIMCGSGGVCPCVHTSVGDMLVCESRATSVTRRDVPAPQAAGSVLLPCAEAFPSLCEVGMGPSDGSLLGPVASGLGAPQSKLKIPGDQCGSPQNMLQLLGSVLAWEPPGALTSALGRPEDRVVAVWGLGEDRAVAREWPKIPGPVEEMGYFCIYGK